LVQAVPVTASHSNRADRWAHRLTRRSALATLALVALLAPGCSSDDDDGAATRTTEPAVTTSADRGSDPSPRPAGPAADLSEEITGANDPFIGAAPGNVLATDFVEHEYVAAGTADGYEATGDLGTDGRWTFEPGGTADYRTRILVRRPAEATDASGTVIVEWLNVSAGLDANPEFASVSEEIVRRGHTWVGVSAQLIGVEGGPVLVQAPGAEEYVGKGLTGIDPERYGSLDHPGDAFAFDIYTQVARALREGGEPLGGAVPDVILAAGESQSALALTTYYNGVQPLTLAFDGFLVHSRASVALPLGGPGEYADLAGSLSGAAPALLRGDLDAPAIELQAESDVIGVLDSIEVRQPDSPTYRLWEVAGTAHADVHLMGSVADGLDCGVPINDGPMHVVAKAALRGLEEWVRGGDAPASAAVLEVTPDDEPEFVRDEDGIVIGGIRTPPVDVPVDVLSGEAGPNPDLLCILLGSTIALSDERLAERYEDRTDYQARYEDAIDQTIASGFALEEDRDALLAFAQPDRIAE
jgi:hypothetical protein